jgi:hypothetical protein
MMGLYIFILGVVFLLLAVPVISIFFGFGKWENGKKLDRRFGKSEQDGPANMIVGSGDYSGAGSEYSNFGNSGGGDAGS